MAVSLAEGVVRVSSSLQLSLLRYGVAPAPAPAAALALRVLCVHGWADNAASFSLLAPALAARLRADVVCLDLAGHGRSGHRAAGEHYSQPSYAADVARALEALGWWRGAPAAPAAPAAAPEPAAAPFVLVGHSMGGGVAATLAAAFPERVAALVLLESLGLVARPPAEAVDAFRRAVLAQRSLAADYGGGGGGYASVEAAVDQRVANVARFPGQQTLSRGAAEALVRRALAEAPARAGAGAGAGADAAAAGSLAP